MENQGQLQYIFQKFNDRNNEWKNTEVFLYSSHIKNVIFKYITKNAAKAILFQPYSISLFQNLHVKSSEAWF